MCRTDNIAYLQGESAYWHGIASASLTAAEEVGEEHAAPYIADAAAAQARSVLYAEMASAALTGE